MAIKRIVATLAGVVLALTGLAVTASAQISAAPVRSGGGHCVVDVETRASQCYDTFRLAVSAATGGRIADAPESPSAAVASRSFEDRINALGRERESGVTPQARVTISIEYDWTYYQTTAGSITYTGPIGCDTDAGPELELDNLGDAWNDRISSFKGYNRCEMNHYMHADFGTPHTGYYSENATMLDVGGLNNAASSIKWA